MGEIATLKHEVRNDAMEDAALVVKRLAHLTHALFSGAQSSEVFSSLGDDVAIETHHNTTCGCGCVRESG